MLGGKEVTAQVQAIINCLESYAYPCIGITLTGDQELKSKALVTWLRDKGIHWQSC